jgi:hypothetical protein
MTYIVHTQQYNYGAGAQNPNAQYEPFAPVDMYIREQIEVDADNYQLDQYGTLVFFNYAYADGIPVQSNLYAFPSGGWTRVEALPEV